MVPRPRTSGRAPGLHTFLLPGLEPPGTSPRRSPRARRAALRASSDAALARYLDSLAARTAEALRGAAASTLAQLAGLPLGEVVASPFGARMVALGVEAGATTVHAELRARLPLALDPRTVVEDDGRFVGGVLVEGKYGQTGLEEPFAAYRPAHHAKWGPHELLHRALPFFDRDDASRFELHLGARLQELLPVVTFFGHEQAMRLRGGPFDRHAGEGSLEARRADARWLAGAAERRALAKDGVASLRAGLAHFESELAAARRSLASGTVVHTPHPFLDTASDALAYAAAHGPRLAAEPVRRALALAAGPFRVEALGAMLDAVEALHDRLLFGAIEVDPAAHAARRTQRDALDLALRLARLGPTHAGRYEASVRAAVAGGDTTALRAELGRRLPDVAANGLPVPHGTSLALLKDGIEGSCPATSAALTADALARHLAASPALHRREPLLVRLRRALGPTARDPYVREALGIDEALRAATADDPTFELAEPATALGRAGRGRDLRLLPSAAFRTVAAAARPGRPAEVSFVGRVQGEASVVRVPAEVARVVRGLGRGRPLAAVRAALETRLSPQATTRALRALVEAGAAHLVDLGPLPRGVLAPTPPRRSARSRKTS